MLIHLLILFSNDLNLRELVPQIILNRPLDCQISDGDRIMFVNRLILFLEIFGLIDGANGPPALFGQLDAAREKFVQFDESLHNY